MNVREKLIECWKKDYTNEQAAYTAGITLDNLKEMLDEDETLRDEERKARLYLPCKAKDTIAEWVDEGQQKGTLFYAERRMPEEYSTKNTVSVEGEVNTVPVEDRIATMKEEMEKLLNAQ